MWGYILPMKCRRWKRAQRWCTKSFASARGCSSSDDPSLLAGSYFF
jgi:hypothetical protein